LTREKTFADKVLLLFGYEFSPCLTDDDILAEYPPTVQFICDQDPLRDEQSVLAERLRRVGVNLTINFGRCFHQNLLNLEKNKPHMDYIIGYVENFFESLI
jgi:acetyl esterase/lipase